jgi:hypothetical protein
VEKKSKSTKANKVVRRVMDFAVVGLLYAILGVEKIVEKTKEIIKDPKDLDKIPVV